ncbi:MAG: flavin reductase family protein [Phycisphaerae bacterium]|nr:flavin reductase family protein [Phycisphaerae bacterium]
MELDPADLSIPDRYKLLIGAIVPRPIALVSTIDTLARPNLAPFSFFAGVGSNPMTLLFCPANNPDGQEKDSLANAKPTAEGGTGEFVVNVVSDSFARMAVAASEPLPRGTNEFDAVGLTPAPSRVVRPPRVAESLVSFECRTLQVIRTNPGAPSGGNIVLGQVVHVHARESVINHKLHIDPAALDAVGRMGGTSYCRTRDRYDIPLGLAALAPNPSAPGTAS